MGLIRKVASVSTGGAVKFTSRREAQTKAAQEQAKLARAERKMVRAEERSAKQKAPEDKPWYRQSTIGAIQHARAGRERSGDGSAATPDDVAAQIRKLAELHEQGILTEAEFTAKKTELLDRL